LASTVQHVILE